VERLSLPRAARQIRLFLERPEFMRSLASEVLQGKALPGTSPEAAWEAADARQPRAEIQSPTESAQRRQSPRVPHALSYAPLVLPVCIKNFVTNESAQESQLPKDLLAKFESGLRKNIRASDKVVCIAPGQFVLLMPSAREDCRPAIRGRLANYFLLFKENYPHWLGSEATLDMDLPPVDSPGEVSKYLRSQPCPRVIGEVFP
jgi:hypothetical protein